jgi:hypothetical protein
VLARSAKDSGPGRHVCASEGPLRWCPTAVAFGTGVAAPAAVGRAAWCPDPLGPAATALSKPENACVFPSCICCDLLADVVSLLAWYAPCLTLGPTACLHPR